MIPTFLPTWNHPMFVDLIQPYDLNQFYHSRSPVFIPWVSFTSQKPVWHMTRLRNVSQTLSTLDTSICFYSQYFVLHITRIKKDSHTLFIVDTAIGFYSQHFMSHVTWIRKYSHMLFIQDMTICFHYHHLRLQLTKHISCLPQVACVYDIHM